MVYCTRNGLGLTVGALPSVPAAQAYQLPAVAGVATYVPQRSVFTNAPAVQETGGVEADSEKPNWIADVAGATCALMPMAPLPWV